MADTAFLSVRMPAETRRRVKELAARRGSTVPQVVREAIDDLLAANAPPPSLAEILSTLRAHAAEFRTRGVTGMWVFGSFARGEARPDSDVDIAVDIDPEADFSLLDLVSLGQRAGELLGRRADLGERRSLRSSARAEMEREAVQVF